MNGYRRTRAGIYVTAVLLVTPIWMGIAAQDPPPPIPNRLTVARDFLRTFYPDLNGKNYFMNLETSYYYDQPLNHPFGGLLELSIRDSPKGNNNFLPCPPGSTPTQKLPSGGFIAGNCPERGIPPQEYLSATFHFDEKGHIVTFRAQGTSAGNVTAKRTYEKDIDLSKHPTGAELIDALKRAGAKYGPDDKEEFVKSLPIRKLETFLGKLNIISVEFGPFSQEDRSDFSDEMEWDVRAVATRIDGGTTKYILSFEQYNGTLVGLCDMSTYPCNLWEPAKKDQK